MPDSVGRTAMIAVIAGVLFAGFLALTPRLTAGSQQAAGPAVVTTTVPAVSENAVSDPVVAVPATAASSFDGWDQTPAAPEATVGSDEDWTDDDMLDDRAEDDGSLALAVELRGPRDGKETVIISEGDTVEWFVRVTNTSGEKLWGTYVYIEGAGHVVCPSTRLEVDAYMDCTVYDRVWSGEQTAEIWATAWTTVRQVATALDYDYYVAD